MSRLSSVREYRGGRVVQLALHVDAKPFNFGCDFVRARLSLFIRAIGRQPYFVRVYYELFFIGEQGVFYECCAELFYGVIVAVGLVEVNECPFLPYFQASLHPAFCHKVAAIEYSAGEQDYYYSQQWGTVAVAVFVCRSKEYVTIQVVKQYRRAAYEPYHAEHGVSQMEEDYGLAPFFSVMYKSYWDIYAGDDNYPQCRVGGAYGVC